MVTLNEKDELIIKIENCGLDHITKLRNAIITILVDLHRDEENTDYQDESYLLGLLARNLEIDYQSLGPKYKEKIVESLFNKKTTH